MPLYDYLCKICDTKEEKFLPPTQSDDIILCPHCHAEMDKLIGLSSFIIKGHYDCMRDKTGCKGFEAITNGGSRLPMYNRHT